MHGGLADTIDTTWRYFSYLSIVWRNQGGVFDTNVLATEDNDDETVYGEFNGNHYLVHQKVLRMELMMVYLMEI